MGNFFNIIFKYQGPARTGADFLRNAILLSFVAGIVNIAGFLSISRLTTNVTGHFAFFIHEINNSNYWEGVNYILYILFFLLGSFLSGFILGYFKKNKRINVYIIPVILEILTLFVVIQLEIREHLSNPNIVADLLLFAMGMQNAYVTHISKAVVRTTHLTGLFTDLGIEIANIIIERKNKEKERFNRQISIHFNIIIFFFLGGVVGGLGFTLLKYDIRILYLAIFTLILYLFYDMFAIYWRKLRNRIYPE